MKRKLGKWSSGFSNFFAADEILETKAPVNPFPAIRRAESEFFARPSSSQV